MNKHIQYVTHTESDRRSFEKAIEEYLNNGWKLEGGVSSVVISNDRGSVRLFYSQAMTREIPLSARQRQGE